ncbi:uncharacterized protein LOC132272964 [Cornus florida]|uniref:uncharacterized protein LOC132272964 n=1 Tax=Cornus florida TaxID=4283 RepID=UPI0028989987|nr:uncharacterized protein LOC132272964 [Cornus florida]
MVKDKQLAIENFRAAILRIASSDPTKPLPDARKTLIDKRIRQFFTNHRTPDHPTYPAMIHRAIEELNEEDGCSEESISNFIRKEYKDLPWAHSTILNHHLEKLCKSGEIVSTLQNSYLVIDANHAIMNEKPTLGSERKGPNTKGRKKQGRKWGRQRKKEEIECQPMEVLEGEEENQALEDHTEVVDKQDQGQNNEMSQFCDDGEKGVGCDLRVPPGEGLGTIMEEEKKELLEEEEEIGYQPMEVIEGEEENRALEDHTQVVDKQDQGQNNEMSQFCDDGEKGVGCDLGVLPDECLGTIMEEEKKELLEEEEEQLMKRPGEECFDTFGLQPQQQPELPIPENSSELKLWVDLNFTPDHLEQ